MPDEYNLVGYLADWNDWTADQIAAAKMTHLNYAFAKIINGTVGLDTPNKLDEFQKIKASRPALQTLISVGGWGAEGFSDAALTDESRHAFAESAVAFMLKHGFDGLDLDWEYPCSSEAGIKSRAEDKHNFTLLLRTVRHMLDAAGQENGKHFLLTIATGATDECAADLELGEIAASLDFINIMSYDLHNGFSRQTGHHTNLYPSPGQYPQNLSADRAVYSHLQAGVPAAKINLGCAFYGRGWESGNPDGSGLNQPVIDGSQNDYPYSLLAAEYIDQNSYRRFWDDGAKAPYLWNGKHFISYDDEESLRWKMQYIKSLGLGGAMFWEYNLDKNQTLLNNLYTGLISE